MENLGTTIYQSRKAKGLTQEELAEKAKVNLRTIQRIENNECVPRDKTLSLITSVLELNLPATISNNPTAETQTMPQRLINGFFLVVINLALCAIFGYLTLDSEANTNSFLAGVLLAVLIPYFIISKTLEFTPVKRLLYFGTGFIAYFLVSLPIVGFPLGFSSGLYICLALATATLFYGAKFVKYP